MLTISSLKFLHTLHFAVVALIIGLPFASQLFVRTALLVSTILLNGGAHRNGADRRLSIIVYRSLQEARFDRFDQNVKAPQTRRSGSD